jgi:hypothetical protein
VLSSNEMEGFFTRSFCLLPRCRTYSFLMDEFTSYQSSDNRRVLASIGYSEYRGDAHYTH